MNDELTPEERAQSIADNLATLMVPDLIYIMEPDEHEIYRQRAAAGHDVYAYRIDPSPAGATLAYNIWDTDIRIPYSDKLLTWQLMSYQQIANRATAALYQLVLQRGNTIVTVRRYYRASTVERHILAYVQHLNVFGGQPEDSTL